MMCSWLLWLQSQWSHEPQSQTCIAWLIVSPKASFDDCIIYSPKIKITFIKRFTTMKSEFNVLLASFKSRIKMFDQAERVLSQYLFKFFNSLI